MLFRSLQAGIPDGAKLFDLIAVTIALSIILHSSTDVPVARILSIEPPDNLPAGQHDPSFDRQESESPSNKP